MREIEELLDVPKSTVHDIIKRFKETGVNERRTGSERPRTSRTTANKRKIKGRIPHQSVESLKKSLVAAWNKIPQDVIDRAVDDFPTRLQKCIDAQGVRFENKVKLVFLLKIK